MSGNEQDLPFHLHIPLHSCIQLIFLFYFILFSAAEVIFLQVQKGTFPFPHLREKVRKNTLSLPKGNILLLALLYVRRFFSSSNLKFST